MPDVPNFAKHHFEHFQRSAGHRSTGETLLYQAGKSCLEVILKMVAEDNIQHPPTLSVKHPTSSNKETTHQEKRTMIWSTPRPNISVSQVHSAFDPSFLPKGVFMSFFCEALALYLIPCHEILHIVQHLYLGSWSNCAREMRDGLNIQYISK